MTEGTSLLAEAEAARPPPMCKLAQLIGTLSAQDQADLAVILEDVDRWPSAFVVQFLRDQRGLSVSVTTLKSHRSGSCCCHG